MFITDLAGRKIDLQQPRLSLYANVTVIPADSEGQTSASYHRGLDRRATVKGKTQEKKKILEQCKNSNTHGGHMN